MGEEITNAVLDTKLDQIIRRLDKMNGRVDDHEKRIRGNEISVAKLTVIAGGSAGLGGLVGALISTFAG